MPLPNSLKSHCPKGHAYLISNTIHEKKTTGLSRRCKTCVSFRSKNYYENVYRNKLGCVKRIAVKSYVLHSVWGKMISRCYNENDKSYSLYGARGIKVCKEWRQYNNFYEDMVKGYEKGLTIDRIDNNGNYEPSNCKWSTAKEQANNRRTNRMVTFNGNTKTLQQWADELNMNTAALRYRLNNWSTERALTERVK